VYSVEWDECWAQLRAGFSELVERLRNDFPDLVWSLDRTETNVPVFGAFLCLGPDDAPGSDTDVNLGWEVQRRGGQLWVSYDILDDHGGIVADGELDAPLVLSDDPAAGRAVASGLQFFDEHFDEIVAGLRR
jgi:hypothetical protein